MMGVGESRAAWWRIPAVAVAVVSALAPGWLAAEHAELAITVRSDWEAQEVRLGRTPQSAEAIQAALDRARRLAVDLTEVTTAADRDRLAELRSRSEQLSALGDQARRELYFAVRDFTRQLALRNPLVARRPILFLQRSRAVGYMLYEYLGWYYAFGYDPTCGAKNAQFPTPPPGGGVFVLTRPGQSFETLELTAGRFPPGHFVTLALDADARTIYFAFADPSGADPYDSPGYVQATAEPGVRYNTFHLFAMDVDGTTLRQLTDGPYDDFDPCPLPDGNIVFESTRRGSKLRCGGGSPELVYTLHRMDGDGGDIQTLSFHETHEWHPSLLHDGRIVYTRWDYVDRNAAKFHGLWTCHPDGSFPSILFGNYTTRPWACYQAKAVPGSHKIMFVAGGHHANVGGTLMLLDPSRVGLDPERGEDRLDALTCLTPEVCFAEAEGWPRSYFYSPWPQSETYYLVAFSHYPLPGGYTGEYRDTETTGLYYLDVFGNLELLYRCAGRSAVYPIPLAPRPAPPPLDTPQRATPTEEGEFLLTDVRRSLLPLPADRRITHLRVFQLLPKSRTDQAGVPRIGHPDQSNARLLLGTVPVEPDGSAYFRAPARKPLYFQAVDESGRAVQGMRSVVYLQPGERRGCVGCHEPPGTAPESRAIAALQRPAATITPGPAGTQPFGYVQLIQPLLDQHCVGCHDGSAGPEKSELVLTGEASEPFSRSYDNLLPFLRWPSYDAVTRPGELGADASPLSAVLTSDAHRRYATVPHEQLRILYLWLDAQVPFYGTYEEEGLEAQRRGLVVSTPTLQ